MKIVFMGSADFGIPALKMLLTEHKIAAIVSTPSRPRGRGLTVADSPIKIFARENGISSILTPEKLNDSVFIEKLSELNADLFVVVAFRILPKSVFSLPPFGTINIHASLLPKFRGPAPIQRAIEAGEHETGVTIFRLDEGIDTGEILLQKKTEIGEKETTPELYNRLSRLGADCLKDVLASLAKGFTIPKPQEHTAFSKAPKLSKDEARIDWSYPADKIFNKIRAFKPFPGTYALVNGKRLGIEWAEPVDRQKKGIPGRVDKVTNEYVEIQCSTGILRVLEVKPEGRKSMKTHDYLLGNRILEGTIFQ